MAGTIREVGRTDVSQLPWPALPFFLGLARCGSEVFSSEERTPGPKARASPRASGRKPRLPNVDGRMRLV